tara:strand:+ start:972 stop:1364 length:393 start_codon:yes stop_codon:yes gene_type:complete
MNKQYLRADDYVQDFNDHAWDDFHEGTINDQDDFYDYFTQWIDNKVTYTFDAKSICDNLDADIFAEHEFGRAENWGQAGYNALYDCLMDHDDTVTWADMRHEQLKAEIKAQATTFAGVDFTDSLNALKKL